MSAEIIILNCETNLPLPVERVLTEGIKNIPERCLLLGYDENEQLYVAGTHSDPAENVYLLNKGLKLLLEP